jgi:hypothetical protein
MNLWGEFSFNLIGVSHAGLIFFPPADLEHGECWDDDLLSFVACGDGEAKAGLGRKLGKVQKDGGLSAGTLGSWFVERYGMRSGTSCSPLCLSLVAQSGPLIPPSQIVSCAPSRAITPRHSFPSRFSPRTSSSAWAPRTRSSFRRRTMRPRRTRTSLRTRRTEWGGRGATWACSVIKSGVGACSLSFSSRPLNPALIDAVLPSVQRKPSSGTRSRQVCWRQLGQVQRAGRRASAAFARGSAIATSWILLSQTRDHRASIVVRSDPSLFLSLSC